VKVPFQGPAAAQGTEQPAYHRVVKGDTLWELAKRYGLSLTELIALNPQVKNPNLIYAGQEVRVR
jgi:spore coat assembly protein SafA